MGWFGTKVVEPDNDPPPQDPNDPLVEHLYASYPYRNEAFGVRSLIRLIVWVVFEMKKRGFV